MTAYHLTTALIKTIHHVFKLDGSNFHLQFVNLATQPLLILTVHVILWNLLVCYPSYSWHIQQNLKRTNSKNYDTITKQTKTVHFNWTITDSIKFRIYDITVTILNSYCLSYTLSWQLNSERLWSLPQTYITITVATISVFFYKILGN